MPPVSEEEIVQEGSGKLTRADCLCPICLEIFLEPVTLPCAHTFCKPCFLETVDKANMCCPLCRKRVSTWARLNGRNKTLVNLELWKRIQDAFPTQCQRRLNGVDDDDEEINILIPKHRVSEPGELRQEYEDQISKLVEEKRALEEAERRASEEYIQRLLAEEEERVAEERRMQEKKQLEEDERLARMLSQELNSTSVLDPHVNVKPNDVASAKKKKPSVGQIEKFLCPVPCRNPKDETSPTSKLLANKENILNTPAPLWPCSVEPTSLEMPVSDNYGRPSTSNLNPDGFEQLSDFASRTNFSSKRKTLDTELADEADFCKRPCSSLRPDSPPQTDFVQEMALQEEVLRIRWEQEEEDRRLAQRLQRELDRESAVDRRKGSADSYPLRQKGSSPSTSTSPGVENKKGNASNSLRTKTDKVGKKVSKVNTQLEGKTPIKSPVSTQGSPSTVSPVQRSTKQTTLTEMFPNMSS